MKAIIVNGREFRSKKADHSDLITRAASHFAKETGIDRVEFIRQIDMREIPIMFGSQRRGRWSWFNG